MVQHFLCILHNIIYLHFVCYCSEIQALEKRVEELIQQATLKEDEQKKVEKKTIEAQLTSENNTGLVSFFFYFFNIFTFSTFSLPEKIYHIELMVLIVVKWFHAYSNDHIQNLQ